MYAKRQARPRRKAEPARLTLSALRCLEGGLRWQAFVRHKTRRRPIRRYLKQAKLDLAKAQGRRS
jgi:hypothetical protein